MMLATCQKVIWIRDQLVRQCPRNENPTINDPTMYRALSLRAFSYRQVLWFQPCFGSLSTINRKNRRRLWQCNTNIILKNLARLISDVEGFSAHFRVIVSSFACTAAVSIDDWPKIDLADNIISSPWISFSCHFACPFNTSWMPLPHPTPFHQSTHPSTTKELVERLVAGNIIISPSRTNKIFYETPTATSNYSLLLPL